MELQQHLAIVSGRDLSWRDLSGGKDVPFIGRLLRLREHRRQQGPQGGRARAIEAPERR